MALSRLEHIRYIKREVSDKLMNKSNVISVGIGYKTVKGEKTDQLALIVSVSKKLPVAAISPYDLIPESVGDAITDVVETGVITTLEAKEIDRTAMHRPAPGGVSIGHSTLVTAGTLGCLVTNNMESFILSNYHVLCGGGVIGDDISQPGKYDTGDNVKPEHIIADLYDFVPIKFRDDSEIPDCNLARFYQGMGNLLARVVGSSKRVRIIEPGADNVNLVDAAIAKPRDISWVQGEIEGIGRINGVAEGVLGMEIQKSGRTTGLTDGTIDQVDVTADVQYGGSRVARFDDQLIAGPMSQGGDSGSAVLDKDNMLVGLLFAGSENTTVINKIQHVFNLLDLQYI